MVHQLPQVSKCFLKSCFKNYCDFTEHLLWLLGFEIQRQVFYWIHLSNMHNAVQLFPWLIAWLKDTDFSLIQLSIILFIICTPYFISMTIIDHFLHYWSLWSYASHGESALLLATIAGMGDIRLLGSRRPEK